MVRRFLNALCWVGVGQFVLTIFYCIATDPKNLSPLIISYAIFFLAYKLAQAYKAI